MEAFAREVLKREADLCAQGGGVPGRSCRRFATHEHICGAEADYVLCDACANHEWTDDDDDEGRRYRMPTRRRDEAGATFPLSSVHVEAMLAAQPVDD